MSDIGWEDIWLLSTVVTGTLIFGPDLFSSVFSGMVGVVSTGVAVSLNVVSSAVSTFLPVLSALFVLATVGVAVNSLPNPHPVTAVGEFRRVDETEKTVDHCVNCELEDVAGVRRAALRETVVAGRVVRTDERTVVEECQCCHEADAVDYALRAERDDPEPPGEVASDQQADDDSEADGGWFGSTGDDLTRIMHVGDATARNLRQHGFETVADVREADREALVDVPRIGEQRVEDIQLGATHVGLEMGVDMARRLDREGFETAADIREATVSELTEVRGVGQVTAKEIQSVVPEYEVTYGLVCPACGDEFTVRYEADDEPEGRIECPNCDTDRWRWSWSGGEAEPTEVETA
ncbi:helix-hairpin-helix domain-containing protein [Haloarcula pellucida]|uniref:Helix-hairpin-helix DNA-binding motif class 1 domain-containing protein n=1 Tax=Haloarcula pellucida TaxID=1427151 RepID=A0A830GKN4_9EURY|nr:helix-hairpin-helix domain-containing protein [Halomicroarcula pellucida]MBX0348671.1 helix-hairpin-helix domain-containing protein [Halomicroarcula pellucida]GGN92291.1 hypothetical protein GCM10009030_16390 [Halomicroarcula pellucida]